MSRATPQLTSPQQPIGGRLSAMTRSVSRYIFFGLLAYMPFHIFLSTWLGTSFGVLEFAKVAKDGVLVGGFLLTLAVSVRQSWFKDLLRSKLVLLILVYAGLTLFLAVTEPTDQDAEILGLVYNTRFLLFFIYGLLLTRIFPDRSLQSSAVKTVVISGILVVIFGVLQFLVLPNTALEHVGYSKQNGVLPAFFIDNKPDFERVMSTLRDPNSLGSYLIIISTVLLTVLFATKRVATKRAMTGALVLTAMCTAYTFSRSALLGLILAVGLFLIMSDNPVRRSLLRHKPTVALVSVAAIVTTGVLFVAVKDSYYVQNVVFHADQSTVLEDPNQLRIRFWQESLTAIFLQPEGTGPGTAGLASIRNDKQGTILNENYYFQIATEVGVAGLILFLGIIVAVAYGLYRRRSYLLAVALLASFAGLAVTNFLVHIWSNEAVAYTWWGLASLMFIRKPVTVIKTARTKKLLSKYRVFKKPQAEVQ